MIGEATLTATVQDGSGYLPGSPASASTRIRVADPAVTAWIEETAYTFDEGVGAGAIVAVILRTATGVPVPHGLIALDFSLKSLPGQAAESPLDYASLSVNIWAEPSDFTPDGGEFIARKEVTLTIVDDALDEPDETLTVSLERNAGTPGAVKVTQPDGTECPFGCKVTVTITDNDEPIEVTIAADHEAFTAQLDRVNFTLTRTKDPAAALDVAVALTQDGDLIGSEYLAQTVTFGAGEATAKLRIGGHLFAGSTVIGEATLTATVQDGSGYVPGSPASAITQIRVADPAVTVWIEETAYTFDEGVGADAIVAVILRTATGVPVPHEFIAIAFSLKSLPGQAESPLDYASLAVTILAQPTDFTADGAEFTARKEVTLTIVDDALDEPDETLTVSLERIAGTPEAVALTQPDGTVCPSGCDATVTITDNDEPIEVTIAADHEAFTAEIDDVTFTLTRTEDPAAALTVGVALTQDQDLLLSEDLAPTVTFGAGEATATLQLPPDRFVGHTVTEETTLTATVQAGSGYVPGSPNTASTRIVVTNPAVTASIEATAYTFAEGADATVTVIVRTATGVPSPNRSIPLALTFVYTGLAGSNDLAGGNVWFEVEPSDFTPDGAEFIARKEVTLPIVDDALDEPDETLTMRLDKLLHTPLAVALTQLDGTVCPSGCSVTVTITDNDEPDVTMQTVGGATWTLTGERTPAPGDTYTYSITLASGAKPTNEYVGFYLPDSATNQDLLGNDHTDCAAPKQFCATFTGATGNTSVWDGTGGHDTISYLLGATSPHTATATLAIDQDTPLGTAITFGAIDKDGTPRSGGLTITVTEPGGAVPNTAPVITTTSPVEAPENGTAVATLAATDADDDPITWSKTGGADTDRFALTSAGVLTFVAAPDYESPADVASADPANAAANNEYVVFVTASDENADTADTELKLVVQVTNADEDQSGTVSIDGTAPMVGDELTASTADVEDPDGLPDPFAPTWRWYRTPSGGREAVISGATSATYTVVEADLGAALTAKASWTDGGGFTNTLASAATAAVTALPTVTVAAATGGEMVPEGTDAAFTLSRTRSTTAALTVTVAVSQTGSVLKDASAVPSSVTFAAGAATATLALATADDDTDDDNGTVTVTLGTGTGYTVGEPGAATVAVSDNDVPVDFVLAVPATVAEDAGTATVTVTATTAENAPPATLVEVQLAGVGGTATGGSDYDAVSETVRFQVSAFAPATVDGQPRYRAEWTHDVVIHDDEVVEDDETVVLEMSPTPAFLLIHTLDGSHDAVRATLTIVDNDVLPNVAPSFTSPETFTPEENQTTVGTVAASDDDMDDAITDYALSGGADQALFAIDGTTGALTFLTAPDYEDPQDADTDNAYVVEVQATSGTGDRVQMETQTITVTVTNVDEGRSGTVSIDDTAPMVRDELTASTAGVADPDGLPDPFAPTWQWYRTPAGGAEAEISGATSAAYTVVEADLDAALTAKASWTDAGGFTNTLASASTAAVTPGVPAAPSNLLAAPGDTTVALSWGEPAATIARHEYRFKTDGSYPAGWTAITDSAPGGGNATGITVPSLTNGLAYTFQVRAVDMDGVEGEPAESATVTPAGGICARTPQVQTAILDKISGVDDCAVVTATHLSRISDLNLNSAGIGSLQSNDFAGLSSMTRLNLQSNDLAALPPGVFSGLSSLQTLDFRANDLAALRADVFSGLSSLSSLSLRGTNSRRFPPACSPGCRSWCGSI